MSQAMRKHEPSSTMRPPKLRRRAGQSETMTEYLDWRDEQDARIDALVKQRQFEFTLRFLAGAS